MEQPAKKENEKIPDNHRGTDGPQAVNHIEERIEPTCFFLHGAPPQF
jgi:hypothetical protein